jgi:hypothetical protein
MRGAVARITITPSRLLRRGHTARTTESVQTASCMRPAASNKDTSLTVILHRRRFHKFLYLVYHLSEGICPCAPARVYGSTTTF